MKADITTPPKTVEEWRTRKSPDWFVLGEQEVKKYREDQMRDDRGRFTYEGGGARETSVFEHSTSGMMARKAAVDNVLAHGNRTGNERAVCYNPQTGQTVLEKDGDRNSVTMDGEERTALRDCVLVHDHPGSAVSLSYGDISFAAGANLHSIVAVTFDGGRYEAAVRPGLDYPKVEAAYNAAYYTASSVLKDDVYKAFRDTNPASATPSVVANRFSNTLHQHVTMLALDDAGIVRYSARLGSEMKEAMDKFPAAAERARSEAVRILSEGKQSFPRMEGKR